MRAVRSSKSLAVLGCLITLAGCSGEPIADGATERSLGNASQTLSFMLYRVVAAHSNKCMDVAGGSLASGTRIIQYDCHGGGNQLFYPLQRIDGTFSLVAWHSGKCLDIAGGSASEDASLIQWDCHEGDNQRFYVQELPDRKRLVPKHSRRCLDVSGANNLNGAPFMQHTCHGGDNQSFFFR